MVICILSGKLDNELLLILWKSFCILFRVVINDGCIVVVKELRRWEVGKEIF